MKFTADALTGLFAFLFEMQNKHLPSVVFALSLLTLPNAQDVITSSHSCHRTGSTAEGHTRLTFLREEAVGVRRLYLSVWSEKDMRLVSCTINNDPSVIDGYLSICNRTETQVHQIRRFNISVLLTPDSPCALNSTDGPKFAKRKKIDTSDRLTSYPESEVKSRRKRAWIFPGTMWCGTGSSAIGYEELGMFESADRCCREHDHCKHNIPAFTVNYGVFNRNFFTVSHCDCDQRFQQCLLGVNDTISNMVAYSFFNILRVPCFELIQRRQCTQMLWWGMCKVFKEAPYAVFQNPVAYNITRNTSKHGDIRDSHKSARIEGRHEAESTLTNPNRQSPKSEKPKSSVSSRRCIPRDPPRGDTFHRKKKKGKGCKGRRKTSTTPSTQRPPTSVTQTAIPSILATAFPIQKNMSLTLELKTTLINVINKTISDRHKLGRKKGARMKVTAYPIHKTIAPSRPTTQPFQKMTSTTQSTPPIRQRAALHPQTSIAKLTTITTKSRKKVEKKRRRCRPSTAVSGDNFQPPAKPCLEQEITPHTTAITPSATAILPRQVTTPPQRPNKTAVSPKEKTSTSLWNTATATIPIKMKLRAGPLTPYLRLDSWTPSGKPPKQQNMYLVLDKTNQEPMITDNLLLCGTLKYLDDCKYKIPPLEKKYDLQNMDSKTVYHCDCTSRLAGQLEHVVIPNILSTLLVDFVSQYCFKLQNKKRCHSKKRCAAGFSQASDLLQALKKMEEKSTAGVQNSGKDTKRGIPVHLYKRCLRIVQSGKRG